MRYSILKLIVAILLFSHCAIVKSQENDIIKFKENTVSMPISFKKSKDKVWTIDLKDSLLVVKLVSENTRKLDYEFNHEAVYYTDENNNEKYSKEIPYLKNSKGGYVLFYSSAKLVLKKESLPVTISSNQEVIATIQLYKEKIYQKIELTDRRFKPGDKINIKCINEEDVEKVGTRKLFIEGGGKKYEAVNDLIPNELSDSEYKLICKVVYCDGVEKELELGNITISEKASNSILIKIIIPVLVVIAIVIFIIVRIRTKTGGNNKITISQLKKLLSQKDNEITCLNEELEQVRSVHAAEKDLLIEKINGLNQTISDNNIQINQLKSSVTLLEKEKTILESENATLKSDAVSKKDLRKQLEILNEDKNKLNREKQYLEKDITSLKQEKEGLNKTIQEKDKTIGQINQEKEKTKSDLKIADCSCKKLQEQISSFNRQTHYLYQIDDALSIMDKSLKTIFEGVTDSNLLKRLAIPIISGTSGLDSGLETYLNDWKLLVYDNQHSFFGADVLSLSNLEVKEKIVCDYLENLALRDSFSKLVRLYLMTNVSWINERMVKAGFDVDAIQSLFALFKNLFTEFGIEITYPHLFIDTFDSNIHKDNMRCDIFNFFDPSEELRNQLRSREYENLIVDVTRIGIPNSKSSVRRVALVSLPNF